MTTIASDTPTIRDGWIARPRLVRTLVAARERALVVLDAPAGYGKTRLLREWLTSAHEPRRFAWLSLGPTDGDPTRLVARLAAAVRTSVAGPGGYRAPTGAVRAGPWVDAGLPCLLDELATLPAPLVIALDDYHLLDGQAAHDLMDLLVAGLPPTVQLAIATRTGTRLALGRRRASGALLELGASDLRFDRTEAAHLQAVTGVVNPTADLSTLLLQTEGWPAALHLACRVRATEPDRSGGAAGPLVGAHRHVADYLSEEVLRPQPDAVRRFLVRTAVLRRMCGRLCDRVLDSSGSQAMLERLERSNLFVVPLDRERGWYRYHRLFGEMLRAELHRQPALAAELHRRASAWFDAEGANHEAAEHALAALRLERAGPGRPNGAPAGLSSDDLGSPIGPVDPTHPHPSGPGTDRRLEYGQHLTGRETTILRLLTTQLSQREIAHELFVSLNTVKTHSRAIYRKLGVSSRPEATERARELDLLEPRRVVQEPVEKRDALAS
jgi:LuxR family maltose regulon positive regulatory protein